MTAISDITSEETAPAGLDWIEIEKAAGGAEDSRKLLIDNLMRVDHSNQNTWQGKASLDSLTTGTGNTGTGENTLTATTTGASNTAAGYGALVANVTGNNNTAVGKDAALTMAGAADDDNVAIGFEALKLANGGDSGENTAVGSQAGVAVTTADNNTLIGRATAPTLTTGENNVIIGADCDVSASGGANQFVIGKGLANTADKAIVIGDGSDHVRNDWGSDATWDKVSDIRMKNVIGPSKLGLGFINQLHPFEYTKKPVSEWPVEWKINGGYETDTTVRILGLAAQEVKAAMDDQGVTVFQGWKQDPSGQQRLGDAAFIYPLIIAVNELTTRLEALELERAKNGSKNHDVRSH